MAKYMIVTYSAMGGSDYYFKEFDTKGESKWVGTLRSDFKRFDSVEEAQKVIASVQRRMPHRQFRICEA